MGSANLPVLRHGPGDVVPSTFLDLPDMGRTVVRLSCLELSGVPDCYGAACMGPDRCTCDTLTLLDHAWCEREAWRQLAERDYAPCEDCAFRKGSPEHESGELQRIMDQAEPFHCHRGMPLDMRGGKPGAYVPRRNDRGVPAAYPVCMGWLNATLARMEDGG